MKTQKAYVIVGLGYGDEGKGTITDHLCREFGAGLVVRYNGGSQAGHNVITDDGRHHTFAQFGSGTFVPGVKTLLSRFVLVDPIALINEMSELSGKIGENALDRHFIDHRAVVITPFHVATNRIKEWLRGGGRHGSCGKGIGETASDVVNYPYEVVHVRDLFFPEKTKKILRAIQERKRNEMKKLGVNFDDLPDFLQDLRGAFTDAEEAKQIANAYAELVLSLNVLFAAEVREMICTEKTVVFEGAQGTLLDEWHGFHPYATYSTTISANALAILEEAGFSGGTEVIGVTRSYSTRHGAGPLVTEDESFCDIYPGENNYLGRWQGSFRSGFLDGVSLRYAMECLRHYGRVDAIALTHLDAFERRETLPFCDEYQDVSGKIMRDLIPAFSHDLEYQQELTRSVMDAKPVIGGEWSTPKEVIEYIEKTTGVPVKYVSYGPTSGDKRTIK